MSSNTHQLKASTIQSAGGGWSAGVGNNTPLSGSGSGLSYTFETFSNYAKIVRVTIVGLLLVSGSGVLNQTLTIPPSVLPSWAQPAPGFVGGGTSLSLGGGSSAPSYDGAMLNVGLNGYSTPSGNGLTMQLFNGNIAGTIPTQTTPLQWVLTYLAK